MSCVLGIDVSTKAIDLVLLDETTDQAAWDHIELRGATAFDRLRDLPLRMPKWGWYEDNGIYLIAIETPMGRGQGGTEAKLNWIFGAVIACLPRALDPVWPVAPHEWRKELGLPGNAPKPICAQRSVELGAHPDWATQDAYDAWAVARYAREVNRRGIEAA